MATSLFAATSTTALLGAPTTRRAAPLARPRPSRQCRPLARAVAVVETASEAWEGDFERRKDDKPLGVKVHKVTIKDTRNGVTYDAEVPEDRYILMGTEDLDKSMPFACRMGCCTACAVRVQSGELYQPLALGISDELKQQGYALACVSYPRSDLVVETQDEDEVYWLQFGRYFAKGAIDRDDYALELAQHDE